MSNFSIQRGWIEFINVRDFKFLKFKIDRIQSFGVSEEMQGSPSGEVTCAVSINSITFTLLYKTKDTAINDIYMLENII